MTTSTRLTLEEFLALPETEPASEFVCGQILQKPDPVLLHSFLQGIVWGFLRVWLRGKGLGQAGVECRCVFGPSGAQRAFVPDVAFFRHDVLPSDMNELMTTFYHPPDLAVEILSPGQSFSRHADKITFYLRHGVRLLWVLDPVEQTVTSLAPDRDARVLTVDDALDGEDVLPGFSLPIRDIFSELNQ